MPIPEEVDEINEFLQKRREKQRLGELPREDYTPAFAKKISLAIFGKPRAEEKPILKSTQTTNASTQAQAAMRQQLDEIMESRPRTNSPPPAAFNSKPTAYSPPQTQPTTFTKQTTPSTAPPKPSGVPKYYSDMPYPPYIQRGLANYPTKKASTPPVPPSPAPKTETTFQASESPSLTQKIYSQPAARAITPPIVPTPQPTPLPARPVPLPTASTPTTSTAPRPIVSTPSPISTTPARPTTLSSVPRTIGNAPPNALKVTAKPTPAPVAKSEPFWKKFLGGKKETPLPARTTIPVPPRTNVISPPPKATPYTPISPMSSTVPRPATFNTIPPVKTTPTIAQPTYAPVSPANAKPPAPNPLLPATTLPTPAVVSQSTASPSTSSPPLPKSTETVFVPREKKDAVNDQRVQRAELITKLAPEISTDTAASAIPPRVVAPAPAPLSSSQKYVPPWVSKTISRENNAPSSSVSPVESNSSSTIPAPHTTLPWKQPFGTTDAHDLLSHDDATNFEKKYSTILSRDASTATSFSTPRTSEPFSGEVSFDQLEKENARATKEEKTRTSEHETKAALEEEISEEEALEKLPFEEVEGLSESDLDYLTKKEKEHRAAQEIEDGDVGVPSELKTTLQRQSTQLEGALHEDHTPSTDEKQEILRRLKKMMEDERQK